jgi:hypothetical protein
MHDLRWLAVFHRSWTSFALESIAFIGFRTAVALSLTALAWDRSSGRPSARELASCAFRYVLIVALVSSVWIAILFGLAVVSVEWLFFVGLPALLLIAAVTAHGVVRPHWWREAPPLAVTALIGLTFAALSTAGAVLVLAPSILLRVPIALLAGIANAWLWIAVVERLRPPAPPLRFRPVAPAAIALLVAAAIVGVAVGVGHWQRTAALAPPHGTPAVVATGPAILVATGFGTHWDGSTGRSLRPGWVQERFSYRGIDRAGRPLPYTGAGTHRSLRVLVSEMRSQVEALHERTSRRVAIVAESEGALVAAAYLVADRRAPVSHFVALSPLADPGRVYYPPAGDEGWGVATGWALRGVSTVVGAVSSLDLPADSSLLRSIVGHAATLRRSLACVPDRIRRLVVLPLTSGLSGADPDMLPERTVVVPAVHGGLMGNAAARTAVVRAIENHPPRSGAWQPVAEGIFLASAPWQVPDLPRDLNPAWPQGPKTGTDCARTVAAARRWLG